MNTFYTRYQLFKDVWFYYLASKLLCLLNSYKSDAISGIYIMDAKVKQPSVQNLIDQAVALQHAGNTDACTDLFLQVLALEPKNPVANYSMAAIESGRGNYSLALNFIKPVLI